MSRDITTTVSVVPLAAGLEAALAAQPVCPLCGCDGRAPLETAFRSNRYIRAAADHLGVGERAVFDSMASQTCLRCGTIYFDPWLSPVFARELYQRIFSHHNLGWYEFYRFVRAPESALERSDLVARLRAAVPALVTYGEVGCPFEGLLPYFALRRYRAGNEEFYDYAGQFVFDGEVPRNPDVRGNVVNFERLGHACATACNRLQLARVFPPRRLRQRYLHRRGGLELLTSSSVRAVYLERESSVLWGSHCMSLNVQCRRMAQDVLGCTVQRVGETSAPHERFDLVGVFNSLDHYPKPLELLRELLGLSRFVYVEGHNSADAGKQHPFVLDGRALSRLSLDGVTCVEQFSAAGADTYSILLRRHQ